MGVFTGLQPSFLYKTLVQLGARYSPCIKTLKYNSTSGQTYQNLTYSWPAGMKNTTSNATLADICGMGGFQGSSTPNQWWRFITAIFLHGGVVHMLLNFAVQLRAATTLERDIGAVRIGIIYMSSGIIGYVFSALFSGASPSTGASGALYGKKTQAINVKSECQPHN
jgi:membrane associated rhomboid family serine protease